jgi:hypothetical protein
MEVIFIAEKTDIQNDKTAFKNRKIKILLQAIILPKNFRRNIQ